MRCKYSHPWHGHHARRFPFYPCPGGAATPGEPPRRDAPKHFGYSTFLGCCAHSPSRDAHPWGMQSTKCPKPCETSSAWLLEGFYPCQHPREEMVSTGTLSLPR